MKTVNSKRIFLSGFATIMMIVSSCTGNVQDYEQLTDEEKRSEEFALAGMETRDGLHTSLFAAEEMLVNPTNMDIDADGRVWITEAYNYRMNLNPENPTREEGDRIIILEDTDGDGQADTSKVFYQGNDINAALGIMVLDDRVIVSRSPHVFVFYDEDGDDVADRKEVMFSGIEGEQHDHGMHAFVFGPDGKFYFNFGNEGGVLKDVNGNIVTDEFGNPVTAEGEPYRQGMVFRSDRDGSNVEVLGHNFRNNYEVAVDSYGTLWQSDNDDDGNRGVRINYVMEYGNYGYSSELNGADWDESRIGMAEDIPTRHWHQNDPGVIPNLLQTGSGSPSGILVYEGHLLPEVFQNEMIHAEPGHNVVRSYPVEKDGAGYTAEIEYILEGVQDQWFRPADVTVAPDGSIFVADWYDPGVGGHQMGDQQRGRIYRIAPQDTPYEIPDYDLNTLEGSIEALKSPNMNLRARAWLRLHERGEEAEQVLAGLWNSGDNARYRARALWLLSKLEDNGQDYIDQALSDPNSDLRITGLRAARQLDMDLIPILQELADDSSPQVRREVAIALHHNASPEAADIWVQLANQHNGNDRWYLEALGIGASGQWDRFFEAWLENVGSDWNTPAGRDIVWRSRAEAALPMLTDLILDPSVESQIKPRYFRAFQFNNSSDYSDELVRVLQGDMPDQQRLNVMTLKLLDTEDLQDSPIVQQRLEETLEAVAGTQEYLDLIENFEVENQNEKLFSLVTSYPDSSLGSNAAELLLEYGGEEYLTSVLEGDNGQEKANIITVLGNTSGSTSSEILLNFALNPRNSLPLRQEAVRGLGSGQLVELYRSGVLPEALYEAAGGVLTNSWRADIQAIGRELTGQTQTTTQANLAPISELVSMEGVPENGRVVFERYCQICHVVNGQGMHYGPALSEIGGKLPKEGLYDAIINPSSGINFGYEGYVLTLEDGSQVAGIIRNETETELILVMPGGAVEEFSISEISSREQLEQSLMPALHTSMNQQELVDLVEYLNTLE